MIDFSSLALGFVLGGLAVAQGFIIRELGDRKRPKRAPRAAPMPAQMALGLDDEADEAPAPAPAAGPRPAPVRMKPPSMRQYLSELSTKERGVQVVKGNS